MLGSGPQGNQCQVGVSPCPHLGIFSLGPLGCFWRRCLSSYCVKEERRDEQALVVSILGTGWSWVKCLPNKASPTCSTQLVGQCQGRTWVSRHSVYKRWHHVLDLSLELCRTLVGWGVPFRACCKFQFYGSSSVSNSTHPQSLMTWDQIPSSHVSLFIYLFEWPGKGYGLWLWKTEAHIQLLKV